MGRLLFVCARNVCRSPYVAAVVSALDAADGDPTLLITSRGVQVSSRQPMCSLAHEELARAGIDDGPASEFGSRRLSERDVRRADLILTSGVAERSAVATLDPGARERTFTIREAVALMDPSLPGAAAVREASGMVALAAALHRRRGTVELTPPRPHGLFARRASRPSTGPLDIPDSHTGTRAAHRRLFSDLGGYARAMTDVLRRSAMNGSAFI